MKKLITFCFFILLSISLFGQITEFTTIAATYRSAPSEWSDWQEISLKIRHNSDSLYIDVSTERFYISKENKPQIFELKDRSSLLVFCTDQSGIRCVIEFVNYKNNSKQMYIRYKDQEIGYQLQNE